MPTGRDFIIISYDEKDIVEDGVASVVARSLVKFKLEDSNEPFEKLCAVKIAPANKKASKEPHDIVKEIRILSRLANQNIVRYYSSFIDHTTQEWKIFIEWVSFRLLDLLNSPDFMPHEFPKSTSHLILSRHSSFESCRDAFIAVSKSVIYQIVAAVNFLHSLDPPIAHRDVKPGNILINDSGRVQLIDFGIAWEAGVKPSSGDLWPESKAKMYCDVGTGPYRAPELMYGPGTYDPLAIDLWSLGTTVSHFFTPICLTKDEEGDYDDLPTSGSGAEVVNGLILPPDVSSITLRSAQWSRTSLFDAQRGDIGLLWSIYSIRGTPNDDIWPEFKELPDTETVKFRDVPPAELYKLLPNLPPATETTGSSHVPPAVPSPSPLDLIHRLLVYPPSSRMKMKDAMNHPWFSAASPLLVPEGYELQQSSMQTQTTINSQNLAHWIKSFIK